MKRNRKYIWLDSSKYHNLTKGQFYIAEFKKNITSKASIDIEITANARYMLFVNGEYVGRGPTSVGGDFLNGKIENPYFETYVTNHVGDIEIKVIVTSVPTAMTEYDFGEAGLWVNIRQLGLLISETDESWLCRLLPERKETFLTDYTEKELSYSNAKYIDRAFDIIPSPIDTLTEEIIKPEKPQKLTVDGNKSGTLCLNFDKIYSAYPYIDIKAKGKCTVTVITSEEGSGGYIEETVITDKDVSHFSPRMRSVGEMKIQVTNSSETPVTLSNVYLRYVHYPVYREGKFYTSDPLINKIYDVCMHTLKICRQSIHIDSPTHQEPLACTGDYYIQSLIEYLSLGDGTLAEWDIRRTSNQLIIQDGRLFHTTYSLIYPIWMYEHYMHTGNKEIINKRAISLLMKRFDGYVSKDNGLIEYAPDYMFVDWVVANADKDEFLDGGNMMSHGKMEGYSLHHPPKALGQSVLCMFYYDALVKLSKIFLCINDTKSAMECTKKAENMKNSINKYLFDSEKQLYVGGLNTDNQVPENEWLPKNTKTVYHLKQANVLAVLFGIAPKEKRRSILEYVIKDLSKLEMQPYFYHFLLSAVYNEGMFEEYGLNLIRKYESLIEKCPKGLSEAWENMRCDYSHAWGATPAYILKKALSGLEILDPAFKTISLNPQLYGLDYADFQITTPYGDIEISLKKGKETIIKVPDEINII